MHVRTSTNADSASCHSRCANLDGHPHNLFRPNVDLRSKVYIPFSHISIEVTLVKHVSEYLVRHPPSSCQKKLSSQLWVLFQQVVNITYRSSIAVVGTTFHLQRLIFPVSWNRFHSLPLSLQKILAHFLVSFKDSILR